MPVTDQQYKEAQKDLNILKECGVILLNGTIFCFLIWLMSLWTITFVIIMIAGFVLGCSVLGILIWWPINVAWRIHKYKKESKDGNYKK